MTKRRIVLLALAWQAAVAAALARDEYPDWLEAVLARPTTVNVGEASAVVLLDKTSVAFDRDGTRTQTHYLAIRILTAAGTDAARARAYYTRDTERVTRTKAWLIRNGETVRNPDGKEWFDVAVDDTGPLYTDSRCKVVTRSDEAAINDVFAAETVVTGPALVADEVYTWAWNYPVVEQDYGLTIPAGFNVQPTLSGAHILDSVRSSDGRSYVWTLRNRPPIRDEPHAPNHNPDWPGLMLRIVPAADVGDFRPAVFKTWSDVANWVQKLNAGQCDSSPQIVETAHRLAAGAKDEFAKIRALGRFVQGLRYVSNNADLGQGFGYRCRKASEVFARQYGDCKDKSNLLCAMLREVGVTAYVASARSEDDREILADFPSPAQFDHAITAIKVDDSMTLPATVATKRWGRLLFFDPTNEFTLPGDLPYYLQGTRVHICEQGSDELIELPKISPEQGYAFQRTATLHLMPTGALAGTVSILGKAQAGTEMRHSLFVASTDEQLQKFATRLLGDATRGAKLSAIVRKDDEATGVCGVEFSLAKTSYLQRMPGALAVAKLDVLNRGAIPALAAPDRQAPVKLQAVAFEDEVTLVLPDGFSPEELPASATLVSDYGRYERSFKSAGGTITLVRHVVLNSQLVPASEYPQLKKFLSDLAKADRASVLLRTAN